MKQDLLLVISQLLLIALYLMDPEWAHLELPQWLRYLALIDVLMGILVLFAGLFALGSNLTPMPRPKEDGVLISTGIFKYIRHPLYAGILFIMAGGSIYLASLWKMLISLLVWALFHYKSTVEESYLKQRFPDYENYMLTAGRFLPKIR